MSQEVKGSPVSHVLGAPFVIRYSDFGIPPLAASPDAAEQAAGSGLRGFHIVVSV